MTTANHSELPTKGQTIFSMSTWPPGSAWHKFCHLSNCTCLPSIVNNRTSKYSIHRSDCIVRRHGSIRVHFEVYSGLKTVCESTHRALRWGVCAVRAVLERHTAWNKIENYIIMLSGLILKLNWWSVTHLHPILYNDLNIFCPCNSWNVFSRFNSLCWQNANIFTFSVLSLELWGEKMWPF